MEEAPRWVRVMLRNGDEHTFLNAEYQVDFVTRWLIVYRLSHAGCQVFFKFPT